MAEIISAFPRPVSCTSPTPYSAVYWGARHEILAGEWQDALPALFLRAVCKPIEARYLREIATRLSYCDDKMLRRTLRRRRTG
jgi:hypothetical protein